MNAGGHRRVGFALDGRRVDRDAVNLVGLEEVQNRPATRQRSDRQGVSVIREIQLAVDAISEHAS